MAEVQTPAISSSKDNALLTLSIIAILGGIAAFYWFDEQALLLRVGMVIVGLAAGAGLLWLSTYGREFVQFAQAASCAKWCGRAVPRPFKPPTW
jgi:preprotein translocase subunit SecE